MRVGLTFFRLHCTKSSAGKSCCPQTFTLSLSLSPLSVFVETIRKNHILKVLFLCHKMKIVFKTTTGRTTEVEFEPGTTIAAVKESLKDEYDVASLRLCFQGKILENDKTVGELGEGAALFIAGKKATLVKSNPTPEPKPTSPPVETSSAVASNANSSAPVVTPSEVSNTEVPIITPNVPQSTPDPIPAPAADGPAIDDELIRTIAAMGFDDVALVKLALRAAYMNPDRAVDYLCSGTPRSVLERLANEASPSVPSGLRGHAPTPQTQPQTVSPLRQALAGIPNFDQIRQVVQQNPASLPTFMQQLQQNNPDVFALVQQNPQEFLELIQSNEPQQENGAPISNQRGVELTPADQVAIQELAEVGGGAWDIQAAAIVYIAVNKNKEMAAAVLFEHGGLPPQLVQAILDQQGGSGGMPDADDDDDDAEDFE